MNNNITRISDSNDCVTLSFVQFVTYLYRQAERERSPSRRTFEERPGERSREYDGYRDRDRAKERDGGRERDRNGGWAESDVDGEVMNGNGSRNSKKKDEDEVLVSAEPDIEEEMRRLMGFTAFDSTHVCCRRVMLGAMW